MKQIITLIMLFVMAMGMSATPHSLPLLKPSTSEKEQVTSLPVQATALIKRDVTKHTLRPIQVQETTEQNIPSLKPLRKAAAETITLNGDEFLVGPEYEAETGEWYIALEAQGYTFRLCWYGPTNSYCGNFSMEDISYDWTWGWYQSPTTFYEIYLSDIEMTISEKVTSEYMREIFLDATITDTEDNVYVLHAVHTTYTPKATITSKIDNTQLTNGFGNFVLEGSNDDLEVKLTVNATSIDGVYTQKNLDANGTKIVYKGVEQKLLQANLQVASGNLANGSMGYLAELSFYNQDTILHTVTMPASLPAPKDTIHISCTNLDIDDLSLASLGMILVWGSSKEYDVMATYEASDVEPGVYNNIYVAISKMPSWEMVEAIRAQLTLKEKISGWEATLEAYCNDHNYYCVDMKFVVPEPTDTVEISFNEPAIATYQPYNKHMLQLLNYGKEYEASITIAGVQLGETFSIDDVYLDYSGVNKTNEYGVAIADVNGTLNQYGDTTVITASIIGFDAIQYDVTWWYAAPTPKDTVEIEMPVEFINSMADGYYTLAAFTPDSVWYISLSPITQEVAGTYVNDGLFGKFGAKDGAYDFYGGNCFVREKNGERPYTVEKGTLEVKMDANNNITAEAKVICSNAIYYHIKMTSKYNNHLEFDEPYAEVDRTYTTTDQVVIDNKIQTEEFLYLCITAADNSDQAAFFFYTNEEDPDIIIPEGTYPINDSEDYGTVSANPGVLGGVWPSFYALLTLDGGIITPLWLLTSGEVKISKNEHGEIYMEVNARNSYNVPVHIVYDGTGTGITNIPSPQTHTTKYIHNGQLIIKRNNINYNAQGAMIK